MGALRLAAGAGGVDEVAVGGAVVAGAGRRGEGGEEVGEEEAVACEVGGVGGGLAGRESGGGLGRRGGEGAVGGEGGGEGGGGRDVGDGDGVGGGGEEGVAALGDVDGPVVPLSRRSGAAGGGGGRRGRWRGRGPSLAASTMAC